MTIRNENWKHVDHLMIVHEKLLAFREENPAAHRALIGLSRNPRVRKTLEELDINPKKLDEVINDPYGFAEKHGIYIPKTIKLICIKQELVGRESDESQTTWFVGFEDTGGARWGYEGGEDGRGLVCGE
jgi:hypothetical protein